MKKVSLILFTIVAMFSFSGCSTKLAYTQKYTADLIDSSKVKSEKEVYMCLSDENEDNKMIASHYMHDNRKYEMYDRDAQLILKDFLSQYFSNVKPISCDKKNFSTMDKTPLILLYPNDTGASFTGVFFNTNFSLHIKNTNSIISKKEISGADITGIEANTVAMDFTGFDTRLNILNQRSIFKGLEQNKDFLVENLK